jgi:hypothetical protein
MALSRVMARLLRKGTIDLADTKFGAIPLAPLQCVFGRMDCLGSSTDQSLTGHERSLGLLASRRSIKGSERDCRLSGTLLVLSVLSGPLRGDSLDRLAEVRL